MSTLKRDEERRATEEYEAALDDEGAWEEDPAPAASQETLSTQVTIRLDAALAEEVRAQAADLGVGYTSLIRTWVAERVEDELLKRHRAPEPPKVTYSTPAHVPTSFQYTVRRSRADVA